MRALVLLGALAVVMAGCERSHPAIRDSGGARAAADPYAGIVESRADWAEFEKLLPRDSVAAAAALERYRQSLGLPFDFSIDEPDRAAVAKHLHVVDDEMGSGAYVTAFVTRMPDKHSVLGTSPVIEFDSAGRSVRRWEIPRDVEFWYVVEGVVGDELITAYRTARANVYLRVKPDGRYRVTAEPPPPLEPELWLEVADSTWLRVKPADGFFSMHGPFTKEVPVGHWMPRSDSGWYVRTDTVPGMKTDAHVTTLPQPPQPRFIDCPRSAEFEGMSCSGFPGEHGIRRLAYPTPMT